MYCTMHCASISCLNTHYCVPHDVVNSCWTLSHFWPHCGSAKIYTKYISKYICGSWLLLKNVLGESRDKPLCNYLTCCNSKICMVVRLESYHSIIHACLCEWVLDVTYSCLVISSSLLAYLHLWRICTINAYHYTRFIDCFIFCIIMSTNLENGIYLQSILYVSW